MSYQNGKTLSLQYDNRMRATQWHVPGVMQWDYSYTNFGENTGRVTYAKNVDDGTLDPSYDYDQVGRLIVSHAGVEARQHLGLGGSGSPDGPYSHIYGYDQFGNRTHREGWGGIYGSYTNDNPTFSSNRQTGLTYDAAGNYTANGTITYDATGQQASAPNLVNAYDGNGLRGKKVETSDTTYYLRSSVLGGQVIGEIGGNGGLKRGYVYAGGQLVALQGATAGQVSYVHQDPVTKSQRITDTSGAIVSTVDLDPFGGETARSLQSAFQPRKYTTYERDANGGDDAMHRRYESTASHFSQPDPYDGSYSLTNPQSFNRYAYVGNDPVNFIDPSGLFANPNCDVINGEPVCIGDPMNWNDLPGGGVGLGTSGGKSRQNSRSQQSTNKNCILNALSSNRGLARTFGNVLPNGTIDHPGVHGLAPLGERVTVSTLPVLTGVVLGLHIGGEGGGDGSHIVDVLLDNGNVAIYADLVTVNAHPRQRLNAGAVIGTVGGSSNPRNYSGLHFGLLKGNGNGRAADRAYRNRTAAGLKSPVGNFIDPLGANSPVNCPGVTADPAGIRPPP